MIENCAAIVIAAKHHELSKVKDTRGTTHTVGALRCKFEFRTSDWDYSAKTAMFCNGDAILHPEVADSAIAVPLDEDNECEVPYEVLTDTLPYSVGVWGATKDGIRIVSRWIVFGAQLGCYTDGNAPLDPQPTIYEQILTNSQHAVATANEVADRANSGEFDGKDGETPRIGHNNNWWLGDVDTGIKAQGENGKDGVDGEDGYTPQKGVDYFDGKDGKDGADGQSPTIVSEQTNDGHRITVTDVNGTKTFDVLNGTDGYTPLKNIDYFDGKDGVDGLPGKDGNGIKSVVLNPDYTLTLAFDDNTSYTTESIRGLPGKDGVNGTDGSNGKSAYEIALEHGFEGTEEEWLASIKVEVDDALDQTSENPVQNKVVTEAIETVSTAVERLANGVSPEEIDGVNDLIRYVDEHGAEVIAMQQDIARNTAALDELKNIQPPTVDQMYNSKSENAQSGKAVSEAINSAMPGVSIHEGHISVGFASIEYQNEENPTEFHVNVGDASISLENIDGYDEETDQYTVTNYVGINADEIYLGGKVSVDEDYEPTLDNHVATKAYAEKLASENKTPVDQWYNSKSENAQSGKAVAQAIDNAMPGVSISRDEWGCGIISFSGAQIEHDDENNPYYVHFKHYGTDIWVEEYEDYDEETDESTYTDSIDVSTDEIRVNAETSFRKEVELNYTPQKETSAVPKSYVDGRVGNIETAIDEIIQLQTELIELQAIVSRQRSIIGGC